jgi:hypothetical protein
MRSRVFFSALMVGGICLLHAGHLSAQDTPAELKQAVQAAVGNYMEAEYYFAVATVSELSGEIDSAEADFERTVTVDYWKDKSLLVREGVNSIVAFNDQIIMANQLTGEFQAVDLEIPSITALPENENAAIYSTIHSLPILKFLRSKTDAILGDAASWEQVGPDLMKITVQGDVESIYILNTKTNLLETSYIDMGLDNSAWVKVDYQNQFLYNDFDNKSTMDDIEGDDYTFVDIAKIQSLDELIGTKVQDFSIEAVSGETMTSESLKGKTALVHLWDYKLSDSKKSFKAIQKLNKEMGSDDIVIWSVAFSTDKEKAGKNAEKINKSVGGEFPCFLLDQDSMFMQKVAAKGFPTLLIIKDGVIKNVQTGYWDTYQEDLSALLAE